MTRPSMGASGGYEKTPTANASGSVGQDFVHPDISADRTILLLRGRQAAERRARRSTSKTFSPASST